MSKNTHRSMILISCDLLLKKKLITFRLYVWGCVMCTCVTMSVCVFFIIITHFNGEEVVDEWRITRMELVLLWQILCNIKMF